MKAFIALEFMAMGALLLYFLPFWWERGLIIIWGPGVALSLIILAALAMRTVIARYIAGLVFAAVGSGMIAFGYIMAVIVTSGPNDKLYVRSIDYVLERYGWIAIIIGAIYFILFLRMYLARTERDFFQNRNEGPTTASSLREPAADSRR
jgi:hypothetical protein